MHEAAPHWEARPTAGTPSVKPGKWLEMLYLQIQNLNTMLTLDCNLGNQHFYGPFTAGREIG